MKNPGSLPPARRAALAAASLALLLLLPLAPRAGAAGVAPAGDGPRTAWQGDGDGGQPGRPDPGNPDVWQPDYLVARPLTGTVAGLVNRGLASPLGAVPGGPAGSLAVGNGPNGPYVIPAPPYDHNGPWGSFPSYRAWALAFTAAHGREPAEQDEVDYWASQAFAVQSGIGPTGWRPQPGPPLTQ